MLGLRGCLLSCLSYLEQGLPFLGLGGSLGILQGLALVSRSLGMKLLNAAFRFRPECRELVLRRAVRFSQRLKLVSCRFLLESR